MLDHARSMFLLAAVASASFGVAGHCWLWEGLELFDKFL